MAGRFSQGFTTPTTNQLAIQNNMMAVIDQFFVNFAPLLTRLQRVGTDTPDFDVVGYGYVPRTGSIGASVVAAASPGVGGSLTLLDASIVQNGDTLELSSGEQIEVTGDPDIVANTVPVRRQIGGSPTAAITYTPGAVQGSLQALANTFYRIANSRTGAEIDQNGMAYIPTKITQHVQTFQYPVQVGGLMQATRQHLPLGAQTPFQGQKMYRLTDMTRDMETALYYQRPEAIGDGTVPSTRRKLGGLRYQIALGNVITAPTNAGAYKSTDLVRDVIATAKLGGGFPDVLVMSTSFMNGLSVWTQPLTRIINPNTGGKFQTSLGVDINMWYAPFLEGLTVLEAPLLRTNTCLALTSSDIALRPLREPFWNPRADRGDAVEGEWLGDVGLEVEHATYHAWVEGITAFSN